MTGSEVALVIGAIGTASAVLITSIGNLVVGLRTSHKVDDVHASTNGKMAELIRLAKKDAKTEGEAVGVAKEKANPS